MVSYDQKTIGYINLFEKVTRAIVKDCFFVEDILYFVVQPGQLGKALGKGGVTVKRISSLLKKNIRVIEFNPEPTKFVANLIYPIKPVEIKRENERIIIKTNDNVEKGKIFGRAKTKFQMLQEIVAKYFPVKIEVD